MRAIDITKFHSYREAIELLICVKASAYPWLAEAIDDILEWFTKHPDATENFFFDKMDSITDASLGWSWLVDLARQHGYEGDLEEFDDDIAKEAAEDPASNPIDEMMDTHVYVMSQKCFYHLASSTFLDAGAFNTENVHVAKYGKSGMKTAEAIYKNDKRARRVATITSRAGQPVLTTTENESGVTVSAINTWRPSKREPTKNVRDADVAAYLDLMGKLFGLRGTAVCEHFLDWLA